MRPIILRVTRRRRPTRTLLEGSDDSERDSEKASDPIYEPSDRDIIDFGIALDRRHLYYSKQLPKDLLIHAIETGKDDEGFYVYQKLDDELKRLAIERSKHIVGLYVYQKLSELQIELVIRRGKALEYLPEHQDLSDKNAALYIDKAERVDELISLYKYHRMRKNRLSVGNIKRALLKHTQFRPEDKKKLDEALYRYQISNRPSVREEIEKFIATHDLSD